MAPSPIGHCVMLRRISLQSYAHKGKLGAPCELVEKRCMGKIKHWHSSGGKRNGIQDGNIHPWP